MQYSGGMNNEHDNLETWNGRTEMDQEMIAEIEAWYAEQCDSALTEEELDYLCARDEAQQKNYPTWRLTCDFALPTFEAAATGAEAARKAGERGWGTDGADVRVVRVGLDGVPGREERRAA